MTSCFVSLETSNAPLRALDTVDTERWSSYAISFIFILLTSIIDYNKNTLIIAIIGIWGWYLYFNSELYTKQNPRVEKYCDKIL